MRVLLKAMAKRTPEPDRKSPVIGFHIEPLARRRFSVRAPGAMIAEVGHLHSVIGSRIGTSPALLGPQSAQAMRILPLQTSGRPPLLRRSPVAAVYSHSGDGASSMTATADEHGRRQISAPTHDNGRFISRCLDAEIAHNEHELYGASP
jgi:hypothetical protein